MNNAIWLRDIDGTGSMGLCAKGDPGAVAVAYVPVYGAAPLAADATAPEVWRCTICGFAVDVTDHDPKAMKPYTNRGRARAPLAPVVAREPVGCIVAHCGRRGGNCQCTSVQECCVCG